MSVWWYPGARAPGTPRTGREPGADPMCVTPGRTRQNPARTGEQDQRAVDMTWVTDMLMATDKEFTLGESRTLIFTL